MKFPYRLRRAVPFGAAALLLAGCSTTYKPMALDAKSGLYDTSTQVAPGGIAAAKLRVSPADFGAVLLIADSNRYPSRLEFVARRTLSELGYGTVMNLREWRAWAADRNFEVPDDKITGQLLKEFSARVRPLLIVDLRYGYLGDTQHFAGLRVVDGRTLQSLLVVNHPKGVWMNVDSEIIYPVLNELRKWHREMAGPAA